MQGVDFYRRVPRDLTEATNIGATMSIIAMSLMVVLFISESLAFARTELVTSITLDSNTESQIRINFNVTMFDVHCDYAVIDVLDALGTNRQNITRNIEKWQLDEFGNRRIFAGRNREVRDIVHEEHEETLEELHEDGVSAPSLSDEQFKQFIKDHELAFINFFAPWCMWCQRLHPTWEKFAENIEDEEMPIGVAVVDCVEQMNLCQDQKIAAFPTLRWYQNGEAVLPDYQMDRTVAALKGFATRKIEQNEHFKDWKKKREESGQQAQATSYLNSRPQNPGCQLSGVLLVNRVPGNFHLEARSKHHNLNAKMTNLTHRVNHLSFGERVDDTNRKQKRILKQVPDEHKQFSPLDGRLFRTSSFHQAYHHHIKVVSTHFDMSGKQDPAQSMIAYQYLEQSQIVHYNLEDVPEARFAYDISPMSVVVEKQSRKWYDYLTSVSAIVGGTFTTLGLIDAFFYTMFSSKKID